MDRQHSKLLLNDKPIMVGRKLARLLGLTEAAVLQTLHWHILEYEENAHRTAFMREYYHQGHWWYKGTYQQMVQGHKNDARGDFDFLPISTLRRTLYALETRGLIIAQEITSNGSREGKRYRIAHEALNALADDTSASSEQVEKPKASAQSEQTVWQERLPIMDTHPAQSEQTRLPIMDTHPAQSEQTPHLKNDCIDSCIDSCKSHHQSPGAQTQVSVAPKPNDDDALFMFLTKSRVDPPGARRLIANGLTQAQAEQALAMVQSRKGIRSPGAAMFTACSDVMKGLAWQPSASAKAGKRSSGARSHSNAPASSAALTPENKPPMDTLKDALKGRRKREG